VAPSGTCRCPATGAGIPASPERRHELTLREVDEIIERMPGPWGRVAEMLLLTGLPWGEAVAIRSEDIDGDVLWLRSTANRYGGTNEPKNQGPAPA